MTVTVVIVLVLAVVVVVAVLVVRMSAEDGSIGCPRTTHAATVACGTFVDSRGRPL